MKSGESGKSLPNIMILLYDSLIPSMLSFFDGSAPTPSFDFFAHKGASFRKTSAHSIRPDVALGSILTGNYPHNNGIHKLLFPGAPVSTKQGYLYEEKNSLALTAYWHGYRVRFFSCDDITGGIQSSWFNLQVEAPHMDQLMHFVNESAPGPFLLVDRFKTTAFGWRPDSPRDRRETDAEHRELALLALGSKTARPLIIRRMQDAVTREDSRLARIINLLYRHSLMDKTIVLLAGIPGDVSEAEMAALSKLGGFDPAGFPAFPTIIWYPPLLDPTVINDSMARHIDITPTLLSLAGMTPDYKTDGVNLVPAVKAKKGFPEETLVFNDGSITLHGGVKKIAMPLDPANALDYKPTTKERDSRLYALLGAPKVRPKRNDNLLGKYKIPKKTIFFVAVARAGTTFFSRFFQRREFGNVICKGHMWPHFHDINALRAAELIATEAAKKAIFQYKPEIMGFRQEVLVSVSHDCWAIIDLLADLFPNSKFILITRDPRSMLVSLASLPPQVLHLGKTRANWPYLFSDDIVPGGGRPAQSGWVEAVSSWWNSSMKSYYEDIKKLGERGLIIRFEDIFASNKNFAGIKRIAGFLKDEVTIPTSDAWLKSAFREKVNSHAEIIPHWNKWSEKDRATLTKNCAKTMSLLGYDINGEP